MKIRTIYDFDGDTIEFVKCDGAPGFSHRVVINGQTTRNLPGFRGWLSNDRKPSAECAQYFYDQWRMALEIHNRIALDSGAKIISQIGAMGR